MDTTEREDAENIVRVVEQALSADNLLEETRLKLLQSKSHYQLELHDFIQEASSGDDDWQRVSNVLLTRHQALFLECEKEIFSKWSRQSFFGLTGPPGVGKSAFLQYLAAKYYNDPGYLVVFLSECPNNINALKTLLARAYYRGCRIAGLAGYKELTRKDSLCGMLQKCCKYARPRKLFLVMGQLEMEPHQIFQSIIQDIRNVPENKIKFVLSVSSTTTNHRIFGQYWQCLDCCSRLLSAHETALLSDSVGVDTAADHQAEMSL